MKIQFLGAGSAFNDFEGESNILLSDLGGTDETLLIDAGTGIGGALAVAGIDNINLPYRLHNVFITHNHADHAGGLERLAYVTKYHPNGKKLTLISSEGILEKLGRTYKAGLVSPFEDAKLEHFFITKSFDIKEGFAIGHTLFMPFKTLHCMDGHDFMESYGLEIFHKGNRIVISGDTNFNPTLKHIFLKADTIFVDCETGGYNSGVHPDYKDLLTYEPHLRGRMRLYHTNLNPQQDPIKDGFLGFVKKGEVFEIPDPKSSRRMF